MMYTIIIEKAWGIIVTPSHQELSQTRITPPIIRSQNIDQTDANSTNLPTPLYFLNMSKRCCI